jgi:hypothetical protein
MLQIILHMDKMATLYQHFLKQGMILGTMSSYMTGIIRAKSGSAETYGDSAKEEEDEDGGPEAGNLTCGALSNVTLATVIYMCNLISSRYQFVLMFHPVEPGYPQDLQMLAVHIKQPSFPLAFCQFLYTLKHPDLDPPSAADVCPPFKGKINVHHSVVAVFYTPSDLCSAGVMV